MERKTKTKIDVKQAPGYVAVYYKIYNENGKEYLGESSYRSKSWVETIEKIVGAHIDAVRALARLKKRYREDVPQKDWRDKAPDLPEALRKDSPNPQ